MVLAMSTSVGSELESIDSCTCTRIPLEIHSLLRASDLPSAARVDSSTVGRSAVLVVVLMLFCVFERQEYCTVRWLEQQVRKIVERANICIRRNA
jgi:hypothetical protein